MNLDALPPDARIAKSQAIRIWNNYQLHLSGITYEQQGRLAWDGRSVSARTIKEHQLAHRAYIDAQNEETDRKKREAERRARSRARGRRGRR